MSKSKLKKQNEGMSDLLQEALLELQYRDAIRELTEDLKKHGTTESLLDELEKADQSPGSCSNSS